MQWRKQGCLFRASGQRPWMASHAQVPLPYRGRVYFGTRDEQGRTRTAFLEGSRLSERPALDLGPPGAFDERGAMPSCLVERDGALHLYYVGWQRSTTVPYHVSIGLAVSEDGGETFTSAGQVLDHPEPGFVTMPFVLGEHMWFSSCTGWNPDPLYVIKHATSGDGVKWREDDTTFGAADEATTRPWVEQTGDGYRMWFCHRAAHGFREDRDASYRIGYAESRDGVTWTRHDPGIEPSADGPDSEMLAYPAVSGDTLYYNGNGFGRSGILLATRLVGDAADLV